MVVPVVLVVRAVTRVPGPTKLMVVPAVLVVRRGLRVRVRGVRTVRMARRCRVMVVPVVLVAMVALVAMVVSGVSVAPGLMAVPLGRPVRWARRLVVRLLVPAVWVASGLTPRV